MRVPASLAVVVVGASATLAMSIGGCEESTQPEPVDAGRPIGNVIDAAIDTDAPVDGSTTPPLEDAGVPVDAPPNH